MEKLDEVVEKTVMSFEFVAQRTSEREVVIDSTMEVTHRAPPGQTIANERNASRSHLA